ncbi:MFS transporter [Dactylosporangium sp. NPDC049525]|uniref:MFS transporter n=1 Tax=Dactylosporangium sp. NPDC049525 TaxID=3154730 RepID=UPI003412527D
MTAVQKRLSVLACLVTIVLAILDQNIVSAATVPIVRDLDPEHGLELLPWLITSYALAATAALPLYGKLCDIHGARRVFIAAVGVFLLGSALCGTAQTMGQLIAFRGLQGLGGGGLMSVTMVVIAQLSEPGERAGRGGMAGLIAGLGMVAGPLIGGVLVDSGQWRWIFYVNLPLGLFALAVAGTVMRLPQPGRRHRIDYLGAALVAAAASALLLVAEWGGHRFAWASAPVVGLAIGGTALVGLFLWRQAVAAEPVLPLSLFRNPTLRVALPIQALLGVAMMAAIVYVMVYLQVVRGVTPSGAGRYLIPVAAGIGLSGLLANAMQGRGWPVKGTVLVGTATAALGLGLLSFVHVATPTWYLLVALFLFGAGLGQLLGQLILLSQQAVPAHQLGVTTTAIRFGQSLGSALGSAVFGTVLLRVYLAKAPAGTSMGSGAPTAPDAFVSAIGTVFLCGAGVMAVAFVLALLLRVPAARTAGQALERVPA